MPDYDHLPLFGLHSVLFPEMTLPLHIFEPRYQQLIAECVERREPFGIVLLKSGADVQALSKEAAIPHRVGTLARITQCEWLPDGRAHIEVVGETRFTIAETYNDRPYMTGQAAPFWEQASDPLYLQPLFNRVSTLFRAYLVTVLEGAQRHLSGFQLPQDPTLLSFAVACLLPIPAARKQRLLATPYTDVRLREELEILQVEQEALESVALSRNMRARGRDKDDPAQTSAPAIVMPVDSAALRRYLSKN